jgi:hypothetical protein
MITDGSRPHAQSRSGAAGPSEQGQDHLSIEVLQDNGTFQGEGFSIAAIQQHR